MNFFITGGSRGIGSAMVQDIAAAGHQIAFTYNVNKEMAADLKTSLSSKHPGAKFEAYQLDVRDSTAVEEVAQQAADEFQTVDAVVLNAAANHIGLAVSMSDGDWQDIIDVNLTGAFYVCREFLPVFLAQKRGRFVHISSVAQNGMAGLSAYSASKAGLTGLSAALAKEYGRKGITSNVLTLGFFDTDMTRDQMPELQKEFWQRFCPVGRAGQLEEVSAAVLYLTSKAAGFVNGEMISLTGGLDWSS